MNDTTPLFVNHREITSPFGLLGTDENALSFALGYTFQQCPPLLQWFLKQIGLQGVRRSQLARARIVLQRHRSLDTDEGITDVEILVPGHFHIVIEAKVGLAVPSVQQCSKYLPRLMASNEPVQRLVALVQSDDHSFVGRHLQEQPQFAGRLVGFSWSRFVSACVWATSSPSVKSEAKTWAAAFYRFLDQEYRMKVFSTEVWVLAISTKPLWPGGMSHWDVHRKYHVWWDYKAHAVRPLYLAFRVDGNLDAICRVVRIEHGVPMVKRAPELKNVPEAWPKQPATVWHFDEPVPLPNPIRTGAGMYNRRVRCDFDLLLSCKTVQEIEEAMAGRRGMAVAKEPEV